MGLMYGTLHLKTLVDVAEFLAEFAKTGSTAVFEVAFKNNNVGYEVRFTGGI
jgi:hypothetical protein